MDVINNRRSIRKYLDKAVEMSKIEKIIRAGMQAPSAGNQQVWEFIIVTNRETLSKISQMSPYSSMVANSAFALVLLANVEKCIFPDFWQQDLASCSQTILLEIVNQGLGGVWLGVAPLEERMTYLSNLLQLPDKLKAFSVIPVGYPAEDQENKFIDRYNPEIVKYII